VTPGIVSTAPSPAKPAAPGQAAIASPAPPDQFYLKCDGNLDNQKVTAYYFIDTKKEDIFLSKDEDVSLWEKECYLDDPDRKINTCWLKMDRLHIDYQFSHSYRVHGLWKYGESNGPGSSWEDDGTRWSYISVQINRLTGRWVRTVKPNYAAGENWRGQPRNHHDLSNPDDKRVTQGTCGISDDPTKQPGKF
jgi:hypothetical protein